MPTAEVIALQTVEAVEDSASQMPEAAEEIVFHVFVRAVFAPSHRVVTAEVMPFQRVEALADIVPQIEDAEV